MRASVFIATSLDGFIARSDGGLDWLPGDGEAEDHGYEAFMATVDVLVMGRNTYDTVLSFGVWPYGGTPVVVLSHREVPSPAAGGSQAQVERMEGSPGDVLARLEQRGFRHAYVDGGRTIQDFLAAGLIKEIILTRVPVLLGEGIPLFGPLPGDVRLRHLETRSWANGLVQSRYEVL